MSPADELRAAATRLEELARDATIGPWATESGGIVVQARRPVLLDAQAEIAGPEFEGGGVHRDEDARWIAAMSPALAAPLAELLRAAAEMQDIADGAYAATRDRSLALLGPEPSRPAPAPNVARALAVARVINGTTS